MQIGYSDMEIKDIFKQNYIYYKKLGLIQYFSTPQPIHDEGSILRLAKLHIIFKSDIIMIEEKSITEGSICMYYAQKCSGRIIITLKNNEKIELGIATMK